MCIFGTYSSALAFNSSYLDTYGVATFELDVIHLIPVPAATRNAVKTQAGRRPDNHKI